MDDDDCDLEALLEVLEEEDEDQPEATDGPIENSGHEEGGDECPDEGAVIDDDNEEEENEEEIQRQLQEMAEKMRKMKEKLKNKSAEKKNASNKVVSGRSGTEPLSDGRTSQSKPISRAKTSSNQSKPISDNISNSSPSVIGYNGGSYKPVSAIGGKLTSQTKPDSDSPSRKSKHTKPTEVDIFSSPGTNNADCRKLRSPVKTQPLKECEREKRMAVYEARATEWCPSLIRQDSTRVIQGAEAEQLRVNLQIVDRKKMEQIARRDLMDSSDEERDEDGNPVLSEAGREIQRRISHSGSTVAGLSSESTSSGGPLDRIKGLGVSTGFRDKPGNKIALGKAETGKPTNILVEKNSGIRVSRPQLSQVEIQNSMSGRKMVPLSHIREYKARKEMDGDWVTFGILYYKAPHKTSSSGNDFSIWKLTDLKGDIKTVSLFLFGKAHKELWKLSLNKVIGLLNPKLLEERGDAKTKGEVSISIDHPDRLMELGDSADIAKCAFLKMDGSNCTNIVNKGVCEYCVFHVKKAFNLSSSARQSLQSSFSGTSSEATRMRLMQKIAPHSKGEVFAGGKIMNGQALVARKSVKERTRDAQLLAGLGSTDARRVAQIVSAKPNGGGINCGSMGGGGSRGGGGSIGMRAASSLLSKQEKEAVKMIASSVSEELGSRLLLPTPGARAILKTLVKEQEEKVKSETKTMTAKDLLNEHTRAIRRGEKPELGRGSSATGDVFIDISPRIKSSYSASHTRALAILQARNKSIAPVDPNAAHKSKTKNKTPESQTKVKKRLASCMEDSQENTENEPHKKLRVEKNSPKTVLVFGKEVSLEELQKIKGEKSRNQHLVEEAELAAADKYFDVMEKKDEMEEKMLNTFEMKTKAVTCHTCNYTSFKASELCKSEGHRYKVIDAVKRFYKCKDCKKRAICLTKLPQESCKKCGGNSWVRAGMIAERSGPKLINETLSIRGNEEKWIGGAVAANINI